MFVYLFMYDDTNVSTVSEEKGHSFTLKLFFTLCSVISQLKREPVSQKMDASCLINGRKTHIYFHFSSHTHRATMMLFAIVQFVKYLM